MRTPHTEESKRKISKSIIGRKHTQETIDKIKIGIEDAKLGNKEPPSEKLRLKRLKSELRSRYNLQWEDYLILLETHNNVCGICKKPETSISRFGTPKRLTIDHCHITGRIRGLLCDNCNRGIGHLQDNVSILQAALEYLKR